MARVFNEAEVSIPATFVRSVRDEIRTSWQSPAGQRRFRDAIERAQREDYLPHIVRSLESYDLPPQLLYVALQESNLNPRAVGPKTRWGRAKGMWQFIPSTARRFGLDPGPTPDRGLVDQLDERHDFLKSTQAGANYLHELNATLAQASGLLAIASYNWGEHRIIGRLDDLDGEDVGEWALFEDLPEDPASRTYWRFLTEYKDRMPDETKDYVLKIFSAAVVGENPRLFGIDLDNPIAPYTREASARLLRVADAEL
jgi:membrane-bound lytic murein transglycosylase MltF